MGNPSVGTTEWNEIASAHFGKWLEREPVDNYTKKHPLLMWLRSNQASTDGGNKQHWPIFYGRSAIGRSYNKGQATNPVGTESTHTAEADIAFWAEPIVVYHTDQVRAGGGGAIFDYMKQQYRAAKAGLTRKHAELLWATSKASSTDPDSLPLAIPNDPTSSGAFCGLNGAAGAQTYWRNKYENGGGSFSSSAVGYFDKICNDIAEEGGDPELIVTTKTVFQYIQAWARGKYSLNAQTTKAGKQMADAGVPVLSFNGIPVIHDPNVDSGKAYFLSSDAIEWVSVKGGDYTMMADGFESTQASGVMGSIAHMRLEGYLRVRDRRRLGVVHTITSA